MFDAFEIINKIKKNLTRQDLLLLLLFLGLFITSRLINLDRFPIFGDEGIYVRWAKVAWHDASWRFISLTDGKQPLQTWGIIPFLKFFPQNPLLAGRLFSVATGGFGLVGLVSCCYYLFGKRSMYFAAFFYIFTPFFLFYDRMALVDSAVNAFAIWIFFLSIILIRTIRLDVALIYGLMTGMALLAKSSVRLFLGLGFLAIIFLVSVQKKTSDRRDVIKKSINYSILYFLSSTLALVIYNIQRLSPFFHYIAEKNKTFVMTLGEFTKSPFVNFLGNIKIIPYYVLSEMGYVISLIGLIGLYFLFKKDKRLAQYIVLWIIIPFVILGFVSKVIFPRYLIFVGSMLIIPAVYVISQVKNKTTLIITMVLIVLSITYFDYAIVFDHKNIPFPEVDRGQYVEGVTAGWGIKEIVDYSRQKSKEKKVILLAEGNFGVIGDQIDAYLWPIENMELRGYWPLDKNELLQNQKELTTNYVYVIFSHRQDFPVDWPIKHIKRYGKPGDKAAIYFSELLPPGSF